MKISKQEYRVATVVLKNLETQGATIGMLPEDLQDEYNRLKGIVQEYRQQNEDKRPVSEIVSRQELFKQQVKEALHQGCGEEKILLTEAYRRRNPKTRAKYVNLFHDAVQEYNRGRSRE